MGSSGSRNDYQNEQMPNQMYYQQQASQMMPCNYPRDTNNVGMDDLFDDTLKRHKSRAKELKSHPVGMRSQGETKNIVDMSSSKWNMDQTNNLYFRPKYQMIVGNGKNQIPNVTHMYKYTRDNGEFGTGVNNVDSISKHCQYRVKN